MKGGIDDGRSSLCAGFAKATLKLFRIIQVALGAIVEFNKQVVPHATGGHLPSFGQANVRIF